MAKGTGLIFLGPPGSGKGTQAQVLAQSLQIPHISTGDILRQAIAEQSPLGQKAQVYVDKGELVPDELLLGLIRERLKQPDSENGWILDGFPRNVTQAAFLDQLIAEIHQSSTCVVNLEVPEAVLLERLLKMGRKDDSEATVRHRLEIHHEKTEPLINYYRDRGQLNSVNGNRLAEEVTESLKAILEKN
jgi:adenylate kinase